MSESSHSEPVSWLLLERYALGELSAAEASRVERAIASDRETRACLELIREPVRLRPLPLPERASVRRFPRVRRVLTSPWTMAAVAAAAMFVLYVAQRPIEASFTFPPPTLRTKGGDMALTLVRDREGVVTLHPATFAPGDRFKVLFTCPPVSVDRVTVLVTQGEEVQAPLELAEPIACGNDVPLPGAFSLSGSLPATLCVAWGEAALAADAVSRSPADLFGERAVCTELSPER